MPIDTSIYSRIQQPQVEGPLDNYAKAQSLRSLMTQGQMNDLQLQNVLKQQSDQRTLSDIYKNAISQNGDVDMSKVLTGAAQSGQGDKIPALQKTMLEQQKAKIEHAKSLNEAAGYYAKQVFLNPTIENALSATSQMEELAGKPAMEERAALAKIGNDPAAIKQWAAGHMRNSEILAPKFQHLDQGSSIVIGASDPVTGAFTQNGSIAKTNTPGELLSAETQRRGQNIVDAREREKNSITQQQGKIPPGYRQTTGGNLEAIPGGPADTKIQGQLNADTASLQSSMSDLDRLAASANEILQHPGLGGITGLGGALPNIPGTDASNAQAKLNTLKSQIGFGVLQAMRSASKTGGALGNVSDAEGKRLEANLAALENAQSEKQMRESLAKIINYSNSAKDRLANAYNIRYKTAQSSGAQVAPGSQPPIAPQTLTSETKGNDFSNLWK